MQLEWAFSRLVGKGRLILRRPSTLRRQGGSVDSARSRRPFETGTVDTTSEQTTYCTRPCFLRVYYGARIAYIAAMNKNLLILTVFCSLFPN